MISEACSILMCLKCLVPKNHHRNLHVIRLNCLVTKLWLLHAYPRVLQIPCEQVLRNPKPTSKRDSFRFLFISYLENRGTNEENKNHPTEQKEGGIFLGGGRDSRKLSNLVGEIWGEVIFKCHVYLKWPSCIQNSLQHHVNVSHQNNPLTLLPIILVV